VKRASNLTSATSSVGFSFFDDDDEDVFGTSGVNASAFVKSSDT